MENVWPNKKNAVSNIVVAVNEVSRIADGVALKGDISSRKDIRLDGCIEGVVYSQGKVVVGEGAVIKGSVLCSDIDLWGQVEGDLYASNVLVLKSSARIKGGIHANKIQVEMGARINGTCEMIEKEDFDKDVASVVKTPIPGVPASAAKKEEKK